MNSMMADWLQFDHKMIQLSASFYDNLTASSNKYY